MPWQMSLPSFGYVFSFLLSNRNNPHTFRTFSSSPSSSSSLSLSALYFPLSLSLSQFRSNSTKFVFHLVYQSIKSLYRKCGNLSVLIVVLSKLEFTKLTTQKKICNIYSLLSLPGPNWNFCIILWAMKCLGWTLSVNRAMHLELCVTRNWQLELFLRFHFSYLFIYFRPSVIRKIYYHTFCRFFVMQSSKCTALSMSIHLNCLNLGLFECAQNASIHLKVESQAAIHWNERSYLSLSLTVNFSRGRENERAKESGKDWCENIQTFMITKWNAFLPFTLIQNVCYFGFASFRAIQIAYIYIWYAWMILYTFPCCT